MYKIYSKHDKLDLHEINKGCIILLKKPISWTSFDVVNKLKYIIRDANRQFNDDINRKLKIGHAGTLDPMAEGLLIACTGYATKSIEKFQNLDKVYEGEITLGKTTASYDSETPVVLEKNYDHVNENQIYEACKSMKGIQFQIPPAYSAIKINGERAYNKARKGISFEMPPRQINIKEFDITSLSLPKVYFRIFCTKGTYIRSIANDFGIKLKVGGYLSALQRLRIGSYNNIDAFELDQIEKFLLKIK